MSLLQNNPEIKAKVEELWSAFWSGGTSNPFTAIGQITFLLFMRHIERKDLALTKQKESYISIFEGMLNLTDLTESQEGNIAKKNLKWSYCASNKNSNWLFEDEVVLIFLKQIDKVAFPFLHHLKNTIFIIANKRLLREAIKIIDAIYKQIEKISEDNAALYHNLQGEFYTTLLQKTIVTNRNKQFPTPSRFIDLLVALTVPKPYQKIADPICGTGNLLVKVHKYLSTQNNNHLSTTESDDKTSTSEEKEHLLSNNLQGFNPDLMMVRLATMNLLMYGRDAPQIDYIDTLSKDYTENNKYNLVLSTLPFRGNVDKGDINKNLSLETTKIYLLLLERIYQMLLDGGTAGIILPQSILSENGAAFQAARKLLVEKSELKAIINLPNNTYQPHTTTQATMLVFTKGGKTEDVWFYDMEEEENIQAVIMAYNNKSSRDQSDGDSHLFFASQEEIKKRAYDLNLVNYQPAEVKEIIYEEPQDILERIAEIEENIAHKIQDLKNLF